MIVDINCSPELVFVGFVEVNTLTNTEFKHFGNVMNKIDSTISDSIFLPFSLCIWLTCTTTLLSVTPLPALSNLVISLLPANFCVFGRGEGWWFAYPGRTPLILCSVGPLGQGVQMTHSVSPILEKSWMGGRQLFTCQYKQCKEILLQASKSDCTV